MTRLLMCRYIREVLKHAANTYSITCLIIAVVALVVPLGYLGRILFGILAVLSLFVATFYAWSSAFPADGGLTVALEPARPSLHSYSGSIPDKPVRLLIEVDLVNNSPEVILVHQPELVEFSVTGDLIANKRPNYSFTSSPSHGDSATFPFQMEGKSRSRIRCRVSLELNYTSREQFSPGILKVPGDYALAFEFVAEDLARVESAQVLRCSGDFSSVRDTIMNFWKQQRNTKYLSEL